MLRVLLLGLLGCCVATPTMAGVCGCVGPTENPLQAMRRASLVFAGEVVEVSPGSRDTRGEDDATDSEELLAPGSVVARFRVLKEWKGPQEEEYSFLVTTCAFPLKVGEQYVLFAEGGERTVKAGEAMRFEIDPCASVHLRRASPFWTDLLDYVTAKPDWSSLTRQ